MREGSEDHELTRLERRRRRLDFEAGRFVRRRQDLRGAQLVAANADDHLPGDSGQGSRWGTEGQDGAANERRTLRRDLPAIRKLDDVTMDGGLAERESRDQGRADDTDQGAPHDNLRPFGGCRIGATPRGSAAGRGGRILAVAPIMVFLEALFALLRRSLGSVLKAIFGWATLALFGEVPDDERSLLTAAVAGAATWPFLLVGTILPRQAALFLVVVPVPKGTPEALVRGLWIALTVLIPLGIGWAISRKRRSRRSADRWKDVLRGFPATLGIGIAFLVACVAVPARKLAALAHGRKDEHLALAIAPEDYTRTVEDLREALDRGGIDAEPRRPPWATRALGRILHAFAGTVLGAYLPERVEYLRSDDADLTFYPNGIRISGNERATARIHAVLAEGATESPALQCMSPEARRIEKRVKALVRGPAREKPGSTAIEDAAGEFATTFVPFEDWQILYRELLQAAVRRRGGAALLRRAVASSARGSEQAGSRTDPRRRDRLRRTARRASSYGREKLQQAAADRGSAVLGKVLRQVARLFVRRR